MPVSILQTKSSENFTGLYNITTIHMVTEDLFKICTHVMCTMEWVALHNVALQKKNRFRGVVKWTITNLVGLT